MCLASASWDGGEWAMIQKKKKKIGWPAAEHKESADCSYMHFIYLFIHSFHFNVCFLMNTEVEKQSRNCCHRPLDCFLHPFITEHGSRLMAGQTLHHTQGWVAQRLLKREVCSEQRGDKRQPDWLFIHHRFVFRLGLFFSLFDLSFSLRHDGNKQPASQSARLLEKYFFHGVSIFWLWK